MVLLWALVLSAVDFCLMGADKRRARRDAWRVPEKTLWLFALLGGAPGGWLGMRAFHHKTRHWYFRYGFPLLAALDAAGLTDRVDAIHLDDLSRLTMDYAGRFSVEMEYNADYDRMLQILEAGISKLESI